ncbi:MAG: hypothetical protein PF693_00750, partial [Spirochaetia bacterium]|nr:hypothetical protein [Spirochaetia bacterium]
MQKKRIYIFYTILLLVGYSLLADPQVTLAIPYDEITEEYSDAITFWDGYDEIIYRMLLTGRGLEIGQRLILRVSDAGLWTNYFENQEKLGFFAYSVNSLNQDKSGFEGLGAENGRVLLLFPTIPEDLARTNKSSPDSNFNKEAIIFGKYIGINNNYAPVIIVEKCS